MTLSSRPTQRYWPTRLAEMTDEQIKRAFVESLNLKYEEKRKIENQLNSFVPLIVKDIGSFIIGSICTSSDLNTETYKFPNISRVEPKLRRVRGKAKSQNDKVKQKNKCPNLRKLRSNKRVKSLDSTKADQKSRSPDMIESKPKLSAVIGNSKSANKKVKNNTSKENVKRGKRGKTHDSTEADKEIVPTDVDECEPKVCLARGKSKSQSKKVKNGSSNPMKPRVRKGKSLDSMEAIKEIRPTEMDELDPKLGCMRDKSKSPNKKVKNKSSIQSTLNMNRGKSRDQTEAEEEKKPNYLSECVPSILERAPLACSPGNAKKKKRRLDTSPKQFTLPADTNWAQKELNLVKKFNLKRIKINVQLLPPELFEFNSNSIDICDISHPFEVAVVQSELRKSLLSNLSKHSPAKKRKMKASSSEKSSCAPINVNSSSFNEYSMVPDISASHTESSAVVENVSSTEILLELEAALEKATSIASVNYAVTSNEDLTSPENDVNRVKHNIPQKETTAISDVMKPSDNDVNMNNCKQIATLLQDLTVGKGGKRDQQTSGTTITEITTKIHVKRKAEQTTKLSGLTSKTYSTATSAGNRTEPIQNQGKRSDTSLKRKPPVGGSSNKLKDCGLAEVVPRKRSKKLKETLVSSPKTGVPVSKVVSHQRLDDVTQDTLVTVQPSCIATEFTGNFTEKSNKSDVAKKIVDSSFMNCPPWTTASDLKVHIKSLPRIPKLNSSKKIPSPRVHSIENIPLKHVSGSGTSLACPDLVQLGTALSQPVTENANGAVFVDRASIKHASLTENANGAVYVGSASIKQVSVTENVNGDVNVDRASIKHASLTENTNGAMYVGTASNKQVSVTENANGAVYIGSASIKRASLTENANGAVYVGSALIKQVSVTENANGAVYVGSASIKHASLTENDIGAVYGGSASIEQVSVTENVNGDVYVGSGSIKQVSVTENANGAVCVGSASIKQVSVTENANGAVYVGSASIKHASLTENANGAVYVGSASIKQVSVTENVSDDVYVGSASIKHASLTENANGAVYIGSASIKQVSVTENVSDDVYVGSASIKHVSASSNIQLHTESATIKSSCNTSKHSSSMAAISSTSQPPSICASWEAPVESVMITPVLSNSASKATGETANSTPVSLDGTLDTRTCTKPVCSTSKDTSTTFGSRPTTAIVENNYVPARAVPTVLNIERQPSYREDYESDNSDCISLTAESYMCYTGESKFTTHPINPYNSGTSNQEWKPSITTRAACSISPPSMKQMAMDPEDLFAPVLPPVDEEENKETVVSDRVSSGFDFCPNFRVGSVCSTQRCSLKHELPEVATMDEKQMSFLLRIVKHFPPLYDSLIIKLAKHLYKEEALYNGPLWRIMWQEFQPTWGVTNDRYTIVLEKTVTWCKQGHVDFNFIDNLFDLMCQSDTLHPMWRDLTHIEGYNYPIYVAEKLIHICLSNVADKEFATYAITSVLAQVIPTNYCLLNKPLVNEFQLMLSQNYPDLYKLLQVFIDRSVNTVPVKSKSFTIDVPVKNIPQSLLGNFPSTSLISREIPVPTILPAAGDIDLMVPVCNVPISSLVRQEIPSPMKTNPKTLSVPDDLPVTQVSALWLASQDTEVQTPVRPNAFQHLLGSECTASIDNVGELLEIPEVHGQEHQDFNRLYSVDDTAYFPQNVTFPPPRRLSTAVSTFPSVSQPLISHDRDSIFEAMTSGRHGDILTLLFKRNHTAVALQIANVVCSFLNQEPATCPKAFERLIQCAGRQNYWPKIKEILSTIGMNVVIPLVKQDLFKHALAVMKIMTENRLALVTYEVFDQIDIISPAHQTIICSQVYMKNNRVEEAICIIASSKMFLPSSMDWTVDSRGEHDVVLRNRYCEELLLVAINSQMAMMAFNLYVSIQQAQDCDNMPIDINQHSSLLMLKLLNSMLPMEALYIFRFNHTQLLIRHQWLVRGLLIALNSRREEEKAHSLYEAALGLNIYPRILTNYKPVRITVFSNWHMQEILVVLTTFLGRLVCDDDHVPGITIFIEVKHDMIEGALVPKVLESVDPTVQAVTCRIRNALHRMNLKTQCPSSPIDKDISLTSESVLKYLKKVP